MGMVGKVYPEGVEIFQGELNLLYKRVVPISGFSSSPLGVCHAFLMADIFKRLYLDMFSKYANQNGLLEYGVVFQNHCVLVQIVEYNINVTTNRKFFRK